MARGKRAATKRGVRPIRVRPEPIVKPFQPSGTSRVHRRRERIRKRRTVTTAGIASLAVLALIGAYLVVRSAVDRGRDTGPKPRTQRTVLFQLRADDGRSQATALWAVDTADRSASMAFVPGTVLAQAPGLGRAPYENALRLGGPAASMGAVADLLGVTVDHHWTPSRRAFVSFVDRIGGVTVDVDTDVLQSARGRQVVLIPTGRQELDGSRALAYATYVGRGEDQLAAAPRLQEVLEGVLQSLPDRVQLTTVIRSLGATSTSSMTADVLAQTLADMAAVHETERMKFATLPVVQLDSGGSVQRYTLDEVQAQELVQATLAESVPEGRFDGENRVILLNGVGRPGITATASRRLTQRGFDVVRTGNANNFNYARTLVIVEDATQASQQLGARIARLLGIPVTSVQVNPRQNSVTDVIVILGRDYRG